MLIDATVFFDLLKVLVNRNDEKLQNLADDIFKTYNEYKSDINQNDTKYCQLYITLCKEIMSNQLNVDSHKIDIINIFKRHLLNQVFKKDAYVQEALRSIVDDEITANRIVDITTRLNNIVMWYSSKKYITKLYGHMKEGEMSYSIESQTNALNSIKSLAEELKANIDRINIVTSKTGPVESIDMSDINSIRNSYNLFKERRVNHVIKTGLQGLNQMFGPADGMALGESILFAARTHNYKSGILTKIPQWIVQHNNPPKCPGKLPMILFISLENEGYLNMIKMFKEMYISIKGCIPPPDMSPDDVVNEIYTFFNNSGYTLIIERYLPSYFGYSEFVALYEKYENAGFKIVCTIVDYLSQMKLTNYGTSSRSGDHAMLQTLYNNICNYTKAFGSTLATAHQLNRAASDIAASGVPYPVKRYSERHFADSTGIAREVDVIIYMEIEKDEQGVSWLTMCIRKHRYVDDTIETHKFVCFKFDPVLGIQDDFGKEPTHVRNIYNTKKKTDVSSIEAILGGL